MSITYGDLSYTAFPDAIDSFMRFTDPSAQQQQYIQQYYAYVDAGNMTAAQSLIAAHPDLKNCIVNAETLNKYHDALLALEKHYHEEIEDNIANIVSYIGVYTTGTTYNKFNVVTYQNQSYMYINNTASSNHLPTDTNYWVQITLTGEQGASGTGLSPRGNYASDVTYYEDDFVVSDNSFWQCLQDGTINQRPNTSSSVWRLLLSIDGSILTYDNSVSQLTATTIQAAIDELAARETVTVDQQLDENSTNAISNKAVAEKFNSVDTEVDNLGSSVSGHSTAIEGINSSITAIQAITGDATRVRPIVLTSTDPGNGVNVSGVYANGTIIMVYEG